MAKHIDVSAIAVEGVSKKFGDFTAVDNVSFRVGTGETFGLLKPSVSLDRREPERARSYG